MPLPVVKVWMPGDGQWELAALPISDYGDLDADLRHLDLGSWSMSLPSDHEAVAELGRTDAWNERLVTITYDDRFRMTCLVSDRDREKSADADEFTVDGTGALGILSWPTAWPNPDLPLGQQANTADVFPSGPGPSTVPAEDVVTHFLASSFARWAQNSLCPPVVAVSGGRGLPVKGRARMKKLWRVVQPLAKRGGIGISVDLVETSGTRADLVISCYEPADRTREARLSEDIGALTSWKSSQSKPDVTRAIVGDAGFGTARTFESRTSGEPASWGGYVEDFINADDTFDPDELQQRGDEALDEGAAVAAFSLEAADQNLVRYGRDYGLGDTVTVRVGAATAVDFVSGVTISVDDDGVSEHPVVGDPDKPDPLFRLGKLIRTTKREQDRTGAKN